MEQSLLSSSRGGFLRTITKPLPLAFLLLLLSPALGHFRVDAQQTCTPPLLPVTNSGTTIVNNQTSYGFCINPSTGEVTVNGSASGSAAQANALLYSTNLLGIKPPVSGQSPTITLTQSSTTGITNGAYYPAVVSGPTIDTTHYLWLSCNPAFGTVFGVKNSAVEDTHLNSVNNNGSPIVEFMADSKQVEFFTQGNGQNIRILVDGNQVLQTTLNSAAGTAQAGAASTITLSSGSSSTNGAYNLQWITITSGTGSGQSNQIVSYVGSTKVATVATNWSTNPDNTSVYEVRTTNSPFASPPSNGQAYRILLTFANRAVRRIRVEAQIYIIGFVVDQSGTITRPIRQLPIRAFVIGDSFAEGTGALPFQGWPELYGEMLGWEIWNDGRGGTGYTVNDGNLRLTYQDGAVPPYNSWNINTYNVTVQGTMQISQNGLTTSAIATNCNQATLQAALDATFGSGNFYAVIGVGNSYLLIGKNSYANLTTSLTVSTSGVTGTVSVARYLGDIAPFVPTDAFGNPKPFVIIVQGSGNDDANAATTLPAAANLLFQSLRTTFPTATILATGRWMNVGPESGNALVTNAALTTAAGSYLLNVNGHSAFMNLFSSTTGVGYMNGNTNIGAPSGTSGINTDYLVYNDGTHPAYLAGHYNIALNFAELTSRIVGK